MMVQKQKQVDPYAALGLPHSATAAEVKRAYREMARKFHPDRFVGHPVEKQQEAASRFAAGASAYALLSDAKRKAEYDHIYKYGGFDDDEDTRNNVGRRTTTTTSSSSRKQAPSSGSRKRKTAIGYNCIDPFAFLMTQGRIQSRRTAGVEIPARVNNLGGIRFAFSSGKVVRSPSGMQTCENRTTEYVHGQKYCRAERVTFFPDGRKEVVVNEGSDCFDDQQASAQQQTMFHQHGEQPWWVNAWQEVRDKLTMCNNPCAVVTSH